MASLAPDVVETLLNMSEGTTLDFKQEQYPLADTSDEQKSKLVKDILAFANAWKTSDAVILVGVQERRGSRAVVLGVSGHHDDATLQQLVNTKTNVPVDFEYIPLVVDGKDVGAIRIAQHQQRPIFLKRKFGGIEKKAVYLRRGSSTAVAEPDEIARMGAASVKAVQEPSVKLELGDPTEHRGIGTSTTVVSRILLERPPPEPLSPELQRTIDAVMGQTRWVKALRPFTMVTEPSREERVAYLRECALLTELKLVVHNTGTVLIEDAQAVILVPKHEGLRLLDEYPEEPRGPLHIPGVRFPSDTRVRDRRDNWELLVGIGKVQPGASSWSDSFWIGSSVNCRLPLQARLFADNLPRFVETTICVQIDTHEGWLDDKLDEADGEAESQ